MKIHIRQDGENVLLNFDDKFFVQLGSTESLEVAKQLAGVGRLADEWKNAESIAKDSAILMRAGAPFALSNNPAIVEEAKKQAAWNSDLRRYMEMKGITSQEQFGTPTIVMSEPRRKQ